MNNTATRKGKPGTRASSRPRGVSKQVAAAPSAGTQPSRVADWIASDIRAIHTLPGWKELNQDTKKEKRTSARKKTPPPPPADSLTTGKVALLIFAALIVLGSYVGHVFATQETLSNLERLEREQLMLQLEYNQKKANFDRMISPSEVYKRGRALGLTEGTEFSPPIIWQPANGR